MNQQNAQARTTYKDQIDNLTQVRRNPNPARQGARYRTNRVEGKVSSNGEGLSFYRKD